MIVGQKHCQLLTPYVSVLDQCLPESWTLAKGYHRNLKEPGRASARGRGSLRAEGLTGERTRLFQLFFSSVVMKGKKKMKFH